MSLQAVYPQRIEFPSSNWGNRHHVNTNSNTSNNNNGGGGYRQQQNGHDDVLPKDPRQWSRDDVATWLKLVTTEHNLPEIPSSRFHMNGKALCLMSANMFLTRVPLGGKLLYKDFQLRLAAAMYSRS